jgi:hypothetical protein
VLLLLVRIKAINKCLAYTDWEGFLVHERAGGREDLSVIVIHQGDDGVALCIIVCLPNMVEGGMVLLQVSRAELIE